jgi:hypothetical protein
MILLNSFGVQIVGKFGPIRINLLEHGRLLESEYSGAYHQCGHEAQKSAHKRRLKGDKRQMLKSNLGGDLIRVNIWLHLQGERPVGNNSENLHNRYHIEKQQINWHFKLKIVDQVEVI